jgi:hypothetical protein
MNRRRFYSTPHLARLLSICAVGASILLLLAGACGGPGETDTGELTSGTGGVNAASPSSKMSTSSGPDLSTVSTGGMGSGGVINEGGMGTVTHIWAKSYGGTGQVFVKDLAVDSAGNSVVVGAFQGAIDFGSGSPLTASGTTTTDIFVAKYSPAGDYVWAKQFGDSAIQSALAVAVDSNGDIALCGHFYGGLDFGGNNLQNSDQFADIYLAKLSGAQGNHLFSKAFTNIVGTNDKCNGVAFDASGDILITGKFLSEVNFGGGTLNAKGGNGDPDVYVAKFGAIGGNHIMSVGFGGTESNTQQEQSGHDVAATIDNSFAITGVTHGPVDFGGGALGSGSSPRAFVARFNADGTHRFSRVFEASGETDGITVAFHTSGLFVGGSFDGSITIEDTELKASNGTDDIFVAHYDANDTFDFAKRFGGKETATLSSMAIDDAGFSLLSGEFQEDFKVSSTTTLIGKGGFDAFVMKVGSLGNGYWGFAAGDVGRQTAQGVAVDANGDTIIAGTFAGTIDLGLGDLVGGTSNFFLAKFGP